MAIAAPLAGGRLPLPARVSPLATQNWRIRKICDGGKCNRDDSAPLNPLSYRKRSGHWALVVSSSSYFACRRSLLRRLCPPPATPCHSSQKASPLTYRKHSWPLARTVIDGSQHASSSPPLSGRTVLSLLQDLETAAGRMACFWSQRSSIDSALK